VPYKNKEDKNRNMRRWRKTSYVMPESTRVARRIAQAKFRKTKKGKTAILKMLYGITFDNKRNMYRDQKGLCALCNLRLPSIDQSHTDHDHDTGIIRGLLHRSCNFVVGVFEKRKIKATQVEKYLKRQATIR